MLWLHFAHLHFHFISVDDGPQFNSASTVARQSGCIQCRVLMSMWHLSFSTRMYTCLWIINVCTGYLSAKVFICSTFVSTANQFPKVVVICMRILLSSHSPHNVHDGLTMARVLQRRSWNFWNLLSSIRSKRKNFNKFRTMEEISILFKWNYTVKRNCESAKSKQIHIQ